MSNNQIVLAVLAALAPLAAFGIWWLKREDWQAEMRAAFRGLDKAREAGDKEGEAYWLAVIEDLKRSRERQYKEKP